VNEIGKKKSNVNVEIRASIAEEEGKAATLRDRTSHEKRRSSLRVARNSMINLSRGLRADAGMRGILLGCTFSLAPLS